MDKKINKSRIIVPHSEDCIMKDKPVPWSGIPDGFFFGNYVANGQAKSGRHHVWIRVTCNDPKCPAIKAVDTKVLSLK